MNKALVVVCFAVTMRLAHADQGGFLNSGGSLAGGSPVANPAGRLTISGNILTFVTTDGSRAINATFASSSTVENCSGGGKGGHVTCSYTFKGSFRGTLTVNGSTQAINGYTYQVYGTNGVVAGGNTGYNSSYTPFYFTDGNARILRSDDLSGANAIAYGTQGAGIGQFYGPSGIALDSAGRIYITDTYNDRIVRIDDMNGTNWTSLGTYGAGVGQLSRPQSISIDPAGHIWVLDNGNGRLIRMDDMNGTNWTTVGSAGSGVGQFAALSSAPGFDALGRIYVADAGNRWIVRFDDLNFTHWTTLTKSQPVGPYIFQFGGPAGVVTDPGGKIYVADGANVIRVDDMTGANWTSINLGTFAPHTIAVDSSGMVMLGNGYNAQIVDSEAAVMTSNISGLVQGVYVSVYGAVPLSLPSPRPSAISFTPQSLTFSQNIGSASAAQNIIVTNFGGSPIYNLALSATGPFSETNNCPVTLFPAGSCTVSVTFTPAAAGTTSGTIVVTDNSYNLGPSQTLLLNGTGLVPVAAVTPASLSFSSQMIGTSSTAHNVTVQSSGTGPLQVQNITVTGPFSQTNNCSGSVAPAASCTIAIVFSPTVAGSASGVLTITDNAGTQTVPVSGNATSPVTLSPATLSFGTVTVGTTSSTKTVTLTNHLSVALALNPVTVSSGFNIAGNTCGASVAAGANCSVGVTFNPTATGAATGTLAFSDNALNSPQTVSLSGTGGATSSPVTLSANTLNFGAVMVGSTAAAMTVTLTNRQNVSLTFNGIGITGAFAIAGNTCGTGIGAGASCSVGVTFSPTATGAAAGALTFADSATNSPQIVSLNGTGSTPVALSTTALSFGVVAVGSVSAGQTVTVTNASAATVAVNGIAITGDFSDTTTCTSSLPAGSSCKIAVTFGPSVGGTRTGSLTVTLSTGALAVSLTGTGSIGSQQGVLTLSPSTFTFSNGYTIGDNPGTTITVINNSGAPAGIAAIVMGGDPSFTQRGNCGATVAAGGTCSVTVTFRPVAYGTFTGTLTVTESSGALDTVSVTGISTVNN